MINSLKLSSTGLELIKHYEGCKLEAYQDQGGIWTVGYGTTHINDQPVYRGQIITSDEACNLLLHQLSYFERDVNIQTKVLLTQCQFDALVSFAYNCGDGALLESSLLKNINNKHPHAALSFLLWDKVKGITDTGLLRRRMSEMHYYLTGQLIYYN